MEFKYNKVSVATDSIVVEDIGNTCLKVITEEEECYYLLIHTKYGKSTIVTYGPKNLEDNLLLNKVKYLYEKIDYSSKKLSMIINTFINAPKNKQKVAIVQIIDSKEMTNEIIDFCQYALLNNDDEK